MKIITVSSCGCCFFIAQVKESHERTMANKRKMTMGVVVGNRGFFPDHLAKTGREEMIQILQKAGMDAVVLAPEQSKYGAL